MRNKILIFFLTIGICLAFKLYTPEAEGIKNFTLNSPQGKVSLTDYSGKIVLLYFGFLSCPEACPNTLSSVSAAFKKLKIQDRDQVILLFITLDPERDTLADMKDYVEYFHPQMVPLHGDLEYIKRVTKFYNAKFRKVDLGSEMGYTIDHSLNVLVLNRKGDVVNNLPHGNNSDFIAQQIEVALKESP